MNPMATILSAVVASAAAAPSGIANDPLWNAGALPAGVVAGHGVVGAVAGPAAIGYAGIAAAPAAIGLAGIAAAPAIAAAPVAVAAPAVVAAAPVAPIHEHGPVSVPAPYSTSVQAPATSSVHQPPQQVSKQVHYGTQTYVAGYNTQVLKPVIPKINIAVPTALKGTQSVTAPIVNTAVENYVVNEPVHVEKPYAVPYDVVKHVEQVVEVPTPVHVQKPYNVPVPVPVRGQDIVKVTRTQPIVKHTHHNAVAPAVHINAGVAPVAAVGYAAAPAIAAAPAVGIAGYGAVAAAPAVGIAGIAGHGVVAGAYADPLWNAHALPAAVEH